VPATRERKARLQAAIYAMEGMKSPEGSRKRGEGYEFDLGGRTYGGKEGSISSKRMFRDSITRGKGSERKKNASFKHAEIAGKKKRGICAAGHFA